MSDKSKVTADEFFAMAIISAIVVTMGAIEVDLAVRVSKLEKDAPAQPTKMHAAVELRDRERFALKTDDL